jgi:hypothetical protein
MSHANLEVLLAMSLARPYPVTCHLSPVCEVVKAYSGEIQQQSILLSLYQCVMQLLGRLYTMGSQKVPGMVVLQRLANHLQSRTLAPSLSLSLSLSIDLATVGTPAEGFCRNLPEFGRHIQFDVPHGCEMYSLEAHFQSSEEPKVTGNEIRRARRLGDGTPSAVWLGVLS